METIDLTDDINFNLTIDYVMIVGKYLETNNDFINLTKVSKKYKDLIEMYHFNPISDPSLFINIQTQHFYFQEDYNLYKLNKMYQYIFWRTDTNLLDLIQNDILNDDNSYGAINKYIIKRRTFYRIDLNRLYPNLEKRKYDKIKIPNNIWRIDDECFNYNRNIKEVKLPNTIKELGNRCFSYSSLAIINLPKSLSKLGESCFSYCKNLNDVNLSRCLTEIPKGCFKGTKLRSVNIPNSVKVLKKNSFGRIRPMLNYVYLPNDLNDIDCLSFNKTRIKNLYANRNQIEILRNEKKPKINN